MSTGRASKFSIHGVRFEIVGRGVRIARIPLEKEHFHGIVKPDAIVSSIREMGLGVDIFSFWQRYPEVTPKFDYYFEWDNIAALTITSLDEWKNKTIHKNARKKIRKATRLGVETMVVPFDSQLIEGLVRIFNETPIRQGRPFPHFGKDFEAVKREWSQEQDRSVFIGAFYLGELIGFLKLISTGAYSKMSGTLAMIRHRDKATMNALIAKAVEYCVMHDIHCLVYGKFAYGKKGEDSLSDFKRFNGFKRVDLPRYYLPLTQKGRVAIKLGLHREFTELLPRNVLLFLLSTRRKYFEWYFRRDSN